MSRPRWQKAKCPTPDKKYYESQSRAEMILARILSHESEDSDRPNPCRAYHCRCGLWHLSSRPINGPKEES